MRPKELVAREGNGAMAASSSTTGEARHFPWGVGIQHKRA